METPVSSKPELLNDIGLKDQKRFISCGQPIGIFQLQPCTYRINSSRIAISSYEAIGTDHEEIWKKQTNNQIMKSM